MAGSAQAFWQEQFETKTTPWDRQRVSPQLITWLDSVELQPCRIAVPEYGSGCEVAELAKLWLLGKIPACTDLLTKPWVQMVGVEVLNQPVYADGNVATAGGCLASQYPAGGPSDRPSRV